MKNTSEIINDWYELLQDNHVGVQPKAATLLKQVLDRYDINVRTRDIWDEYMSVRAGDFADWYSTLTSDQKAELEVRRQKARDSHGSGFFNGKRDLLKG